MFELTLLSDIQECNPNMIRQNLLHYFYNNQYAITSISTNHSFFLDMGVISPISSRNRGSVIHAFYLKDLILWVCQRFGEKIASRGIIFWHQYDFISLF